MKILRFACLALILPNLFSCATPESEDAAIASLPALKMAESSELAKLMRTIHADAKDWKKLIEKGELVNEPNDVYTLIVNSTPTKVEVKGNAFEAMARNFQNKENAFFATTKLPEAKNAYNNMVDACITCHQGYCMGPIPTIRKLYIQVD